MNPRILISIALLIMVLLPGCQNDNPLAPGKGAILLDYLPIEGESQHFSFQLLYISIQSQVADLHRVKGTCRFNFEPAASGSSLTHSIITTVFNIEYDSVYNDFRSSGNNDFTFSKSSELILSLDSLWYQAEDSTRTSRLMMNYSADQGGSLFDLAPFLPPGWELKPLSGLASYNAATVIGDTLVYKIDTNRGMTAIQYGEIRFLKGVGLFSIDYTSNHGEGTLSPRGTTIYFTKIWDPT